MRLALATITFLILTSGLQHAQADWAVAQSNHDQPFSQRYRTPEMAQADAMAACEQRYQNCRIVISGDSGCIAIATTGDQWGVAKAGSQPRADAAALGICEGLNAGACKIEHNFCGQ